MDPSLGLSITSLLLQTFDAALGCVDALRSFGSAGPNLRLLHCKFIIERHILMTWGQEHGIHDGTLTEHIPGQENQAFALMILQHVVETFAEAEALCETYGLGFTYTEYLANEGWILPSVSASITRNESVHAEERTSRLLSAADVSLYRSSIQRGQAAISFMRRCRWTIVDGNRFAELVERLKYFNGILNGLTPQSSRVTQMEANFLSQTSSIDLTLVELASRTSHPHLSASASMRNRILQVEGSNKENTASSEMAIMRSVRIDEGQLQSLPSFSSTSNPGAKSIMLYQPRSGPAYKVLVERRRFESKLTPFTREATRLRSEGLARILQMNANEAEIGPFRRLECVGYFMDDFETGFVLRLPPDADEASKPVSLLSLLYEEGSRTQIDKPALEDRLFLCQALCQILYYLHLSGLVHKAIRSSNILFFVSREDKQIRIREPFITGFEYGRPDGREEHTVTKPVISVPENRYCHPDSASNASPRYTRLFDIYSLGLIILEIAHWIQLRHLVLDLEGHNVQQFLLSGESPVHELDHLVGTRTQQVVEHCIRGTFGVEMEDANAIEQLLEAFRKSVVLEMMKSSV